MTARIVMSLCLLLKAPSYKAPFEIIVSTVQPLQRACKVEHGAQLATKGPAIFLAMFLAGG